MDDNQQTFPSLPSNYISILDLQKRWMEQQQEKNKLLKNESKSDKSIELTINSNSNSKFQNPNHLNPFSKNNSHFNGRKPQKSRVNGDKDSGEPKEKVEDKTKKKKKWKNKKYNKMEKGDNDDKEKGKVVEGDDQTVVIKTNFKSRSTADIKGTQRGYRRINDKEVEKVQPKETHQVCLCVEERENESSRGAVREETQLHGGDKVSVAEIESKLKEVTVSGNNWRPKKGYTYNINGGFKWQVAHKSVDAVPVAVREGSKVHGGEGRAELVEHKGIEACEVKGENVDKQGEEKAKTMDVNVMHGDNSSERGFRKQWGGGGRGRGRGRGFMYGRSRDVVGPRILNGGSRDWIWVKRSDFNLST